MKFTVHFKCPDAIYDALQERRDEIEHESKLTDPDELQNYFDDKCHEIQEFVRKWVEYGEYISVEFDTVSKTAKVVERC